MPDPVPPLARLSDITSLRFSAPPWRVVVQLRAYGAVWDKPCRVWSVRLDRRIRGHPRRWRGIVNAARATLAGGGRVYWR